MVIRFWIVIGITITTIFQLRNVIGQIDLDQLPESGNPQEHEEPFSEQEDENIPYPIQEEHGPLQDDNEEGQINDHHQQDDNDPFPTQEEHGPLQDDNEEGHINDHHQQIDLNQLPEQTGNPQEHAEHPFAEQHVLYHHIAPREILAHEREEEMRMGNEFRERREREEREYFERERRSKEEYISKLNGKIEELEEKHHLLQYLNEREGQKLKEISRIGQFKKQRMTARVNAQVASARTENLSLPSTSQEKNQQENAGQQRTADGNQNEQSLPSPLESTEESTEVHGNGREAITTDDNAVPALHTGECSINPEGTEQEKDDNTSTNVVNDKEQNDSGNQPVLGVHAIGPEAMEQNESKEK